MSQENFKKNIRKVTKNVNAYYKQKKSEYVCLALHEHLGLVQNFVKVTEYLVGSKMSLLIPDLFSNIAGDSLQDNQFGAIKQLKYQDVERIVSQCMEFLKSKYKKIIIIGFSVGAAYGFKIVERLQGFSNAYLFYGLPNINYLSIEKIKTPCTLFYGTEDTIKYLSDPRMYQFMIDKCKDNNFIKFQKVNGASHGFMNPLSTNFSQKALKQCQIVFKSQLPKQLVQQEKGNSQKKQDCHIF